MIAPLNTTTKKRLALMGLSEVGEMLEEIAMYVNSMIIGYNNAKAELEKAESEEQCDGDNCRLRSDVLEKPEGEEKRDNRNRGSKFKWN